MTERVRMLAGELYDPLDSELVAAQGARAGPLPGLNATREAQGDERRDVTAGAASASHA